MGELSPYRAQVALAARAVTVRAESFTWFGRPNRPLNPRLRAALTAELLRKHLTDQLAGALYESFYTRIRPVPAFEDHAAWAATDPGFVESLSAANAGRGGWQAGWTVLARDGEAMRVARDGLRIRVAASECEAAGEWVRVRVEAEERAVQPGFYIAHGDADGADGVLEVRVYFHPCLDGAPGLVAALTSGLNATGVPFSFKVVTERVALARPDAAVLYLDEHTWPRARAVLCALPGGLLRAGSPPFTKSLAPGMAVAEHVPAHGGSFGTSRCRLLAEGLLDAHDRGLTTLPERVDAVAGRFASLDLDLDRAHLAPGSHDGYEL